MPGMADSALRLLRRLLGSRGRAEGAYAGKATLLDGAAAVAVTEALISEAAGLGGGFPAERAALAWRAEQRNHGANLFGAPLSGQRAEGPRGALAAAMGQAAAGVRATAFLSGPDLADARTLLQGAVGRRLPLVIHVCARALPAQGEAHGGGHAAVHAVVDSGCPLLLAANVQEAVDFALIARRVVEQMLLPVVVAMDSDPTAISAQDVRLPSRDLVARYVGDPGDLIELTDDAQRLLFGERRHRLPVWHDPDRPLLQGALQPPELWAMGRAAAAQWLDTGLEAALTSAFAEFARLTGRRYQAVEGHRTEGARLVLAAQGATLEPARALADTGAFGVGVLAIRVLYPFPGGEAARLLGHGRPVAVLESVESPSVGDAPLLRELRAALDRALEQGVHGPNLYPGYPVLKQKQRPRWLSVIYGATPAPADLAALCRRIPDIRHPRVYLGMAFDRPVSDYPKRQVLLDRLRRARPDLTELTVNADRPTLDALRSATRELLSVALARRAGAEGEGVLAEMAALMHRLNPGAVRCRPDPNPAAWGDLCVDRLTLSGEARPWPAEAVGADAALLLRPADGDRVRLNPGGLLAVLSPLPDDALWLRLPESVRRHLRDPAAALFRVNPRGDGGDDHDFLLGALCSALLQTGRVDASRRRLLDLQRRSAAEQADGEAALADFAAGLEAAHRVDVAALPEVPPDALSAADERIPEAVRRHGRIGDSHDNLARFWDQVGAPYRDGNADELVADPYLALGSTPARCAGLFDVAASRRYFPRFDAVACTGCGRCWAGCPDGAVRATAVTAAQVMDGGIRAARADALRPLAARLAAGVSAACLSGAAEQVTFGELLNRCYDGISAKLPFPAERKTAMRQALERLIGAVGTLAPAVTDACFREPEGQEKGSGRLLFLTPDPDRCKGCGICARVCEAGALRLEKQAADLLNLAHESRIAMERLPAADPAFVEAIARHPDLEQGAAFFLGLGMTQALAGVDTSEPGSGARLTLRSALCATLRARRPQAGGWLDKVAAARAAIAARIRELLAETLPADDLETLADGLERLHGQPADVGMLLGRAEDAPDSNLDTERLRRLVRLAQDLADLQWRLESGPHGAGRAAYALVLSADAGSGWAPLFPTNPFAGPVLLESQGDGPQLAAGLIEGHLRLTLQGARLLRLAEIELRSPDAAERRWQELQALNWRDLTPDERDGCPTLLLVGDASLLAGRGLAQTVWLLGSGLPVKLLVLTELDLGLAAPPGLGGGLPAAPDPSAELALLALSQREALVARSALGMTGHLLNTLDAALDFPGPALVQVHAPSPAGHGFAPDETLERARLAVASRVFPLFRYDPRRQGVFGSRLDLDGNPLPDQSLDGMTPAHWALGERRFADCFERVADDHPETIELADYLVLDEAERARRVPVVRTAADGEAPLCYRVSEPLVEVCRRRLAAWRMLQELAGVVTPFTERVERAAEQRVAQERQAELDALVRDYESRIAGLREQYRQETREQVRERLLQIAGYRRAAG